MADVIDMSERRRPVWYALHIGHHYDGTIEYFVEGVADDERSREAVNHAVARYAAQRMNVLDIEEAITSRIRALSSDETDQNVRERRRLEGALALLWEDAP